MLTGVSHVSVAVRDLAIAADRSARFLGRAPSWRGSDPASAMARVLFRLDNTSLQLLSGSGSNGEGVELTRWIEAHGEGVFDLGFFCDDPRAAALEFRQRAGIIRGREVEPTEDAEAVPQGSRVRLPLASTRGIQMELVATEAPISALAPSELLGSSDEAVSAVDHVVIHSRDIEGSRELYEHRLGLRLALERRFPDRGLHMLFFRIGGVTLEVVASDREPTDGAADDRFGGLAWRVPDVGEVRRRLLRERFDVSEERAGHKPGSRVCTVKSDTHGVPTLVIGSA